VPTIRQDFDEKRGEESTLVALSNFSQQVVVAGARPYLSQETD